MEQFIKYSLFVHVLAGCVSLLAGLGAIIFRNKIKQHRPFGSVYFWAMTVVFVTSLYVSLYKQNWFLFFISIFTYHACFTGVRSLKLKKLHLDQKAKWYDWTIDSINILVNLSLLTIGTLVIIKGNLQFGIVCAVFGSIGIRGSYSNIQRYRGKIKEKNYWLMQHIGGMLGSYIGAFTAFLVNNNNRWIHAPEIIGWLGPTIVFVPLIVYEVNKRKSKKSVAK
jgi:uncharacterized membrane protein YsdA (DUF1294 family)